MSLGSRAYLIPRGIGRWREVLFLNIGIGIKRGQYMGVEEWSDRYNVSSWKKDGMSLLGHSIWGLPE